MEGQIVPIELKVKQGVIAASSLKLNNKFACLSGGADFAIATIEANFHVALEIIRANTPGVNYSGIFGADEMGKVMFCKSGWREAIIIDTESKKVIQKMASYSGNSFIGTFYPVIVKDKFVYVWVKEAKGPLSFSVFDFTQNDPVAEIENIDFCFILQNQEDSGLIVSTDSKRVRKWSNAILQKKEIVFLPDDNLTKELTNKQFRYRSVKKAFNMENRIIIGMGIDSLLHPFSVRWKQDKTDIKIEPLIVQCPKPDIFGENWEISPDGNWCINKATRNCNTKNEYEAIVFYKVDNAFPNGLSTPIYGGLTSEDNKGCFINHDVLGPLYLDIPPSGDPVIYKLNQIPELLKNAVKK
jgi:hypothetical protein